MLKLMREDCSYTYPQLSIARYSFIQLSELEQCRVKNLHFSTAAQDSNPGSRNRESEALPLSHCALLGPAYNLPVPTGHSLLSCKLSKCIQAYIYQFHEPHYFVCIKNSKHFIKIHSTPFTLSTVLQKVENLNAVSIQKFRI